MCYLKKNLALKRAWKNYILVKISMFWFPSTITHGNKKTGLLVSFFFKKGERAEGEREIENLKQAPCPGVDLNAGLNLTTLRSGPELKSKVGRSTD